MHTRHTATCTTDTDIDIIAREAYATAASFGISYAADLTQAIIERIVKCIGGRRAYIPSQTAGQARQRSALIRTQFVGNNLHELARAHRLTPRQVRNILAKPDSSNTTSTTSAKTP